MTVIADLSLPIFCILGSRFIFIIFTEVNTHQMMLIVNIVNIIDSKNFSDPKSGFCKQKDKKLISAVRTRLQDRNNLILLCWPDIPFFWLKISFECLEAEFLFYSHRIDCKVVIVGQYFQTYKLLIHSLDIKKEPEHILQIMTSSMDIA